jgi:hypothetical protein
MTEEGDEMHRQYFYPGGGGGYVATPNPLAGYDDDAATGEDGQTTNAIPAIAMTTIPPPSRQYHHHGDSYHKDSSSPDKEAMTATTPTTSQTTPPSSSSSAWTRGGGPGSIGPWSTIVPPAPSPLASPVLELEPLDSPTPIGGGMSSSFIGAERNNNDDDNENDCDMHGMNDDDSAVTSASVLDAMESAMMMDDTMNASMPIVASSAMNDGGGGEGGRGIDISQPTLGFGGDVERGGERIDDRDDECDGDGANRRMRRRRSNTIHWGDNATMAGHRPAHASDPLRMSASATLQTAAYSLESSSSSSSSSPFGGGYRENIPQRHHPLRSSASAVLQSAPFAFPPRPIPPPAPAVFPPSRFVSSASAPPSGGHRGGGGGGGDVPLGTSQSFGSYQSELQSEGGCSESDSGGCASPPTGGTFAAGGAGGGGGGLGGGGGGGVGGGGGGGGGGVAAGTTSGIATAHVSFAASESSTSSRAGGAGRTIVDKRQRRLERNRESARVSRRRRKFYLEELECKVTVLSEEMDVGRMAHANAAVRAMRDMRSRALDDAEILLAPPVRKSSGIHHNVVVARAVNDHHRLPIGAQLAPPAAAGTAASTSSLERTAKALITNLSRTSAELQVVQTFMKQHLLSLVQPTSTRFVLWLSLQDDVFFRGGRSASERLSAARIGERVS